MNTDILKGKWNELKGSAKEKWGKLTDDEVDEADGNFDQLVGKVQAKYGYARDKAEAEVSEWMNSLSK